MIKLTLATPDREILNTEVKRVTISTQDGEITILRGHMPLFSVIEMGQLVVETNEGKIDVYSAYNGVINVSDSLNKDYKGTHVRVLIESVDDISLLKESELQDAIDRAQKANEENMTSEGIDTTLVTQINLNKLKLLKRYK
jgi:F0F1-type ATP synthase epsilon subunit